MSQLVADATILASGYTLDAIPNHPMVGGVNILQSVIKKDSPLFQDAAKRMRNRINGLEQSWSDFGSASRVARVEKLSELTTTLLAPGFVVKSAKSFINYNRFAQLSPPNFHALEKMSLVLKPVKSLTLQEIRGMKNTELMYVITQKGELIMTDQVYDHWHLARGKPVKGAGDVYIGEHGNIVAVDSRSGGFAPKSEKLGSLVEHVFEKNGFTEVKGRFEDWHKKIYSKPLPGTIIPIPKITHDGLWQPLTGVAFLKELYKPNGIFSNGEHEQKRSQLLLNTDGSAASFSFISTAQASPIEMKTKTLSQSDILSMLGKQSFSDHDFNKITQYIDHTHPHVASSSSIDFHHLMSSVFPTGAESLKNQGHYLLSQVRKADPSMKNATAHDLVRHPVFQNELNLFQYGANLSWNQTQLLALTASQLKDSDSKISERPDMKSVKKTLDSLESTIKTDLSDSKKSQVLQWVDAESKKIAWPEVKTGPVQLDRSSITWAGVNASCLIASDLALLTGNHGVAKKITTLGETAIGFSTGMQLMAVHPVLGLAGIAHSLARCFFSFFDDDDDDGIGEQLGAIQGSIVHGINHVLTQQHEIAQDLSKKIIYAHQAAMNRFDRIDHGLIDIQQTILHSYKQLSMQQIHISRQIDGLTRQLSETEQNILTGLLRAHQSITQCLQIVGQSMMRNFNALCEQLNVGFGSLDTHIKNVEYRLGMQVANYSFMQKHLSLEILHEQQQIRDILLSSTEQKYQKDREQLEEKHQKKLGLKKDWFEKTTSYAERVLGKIPPKKIKLDKLALALGKSLNPPDEKETLKARTICTEIGGEDQWKKTDPFDVINLLRQIFYDEVSDFKQNELVKNSFPHLQASSINLHAYLKVLKQSESVDPELFEKLQLYVHKLREILYFCHALADPSCIKSIFSRAGKATKIAGNVLEKMFQQFQNEWLGDLRKKLHNLLSNYKIIYAHLKNDDDLKGIGSVQEKKIDDLKISFLTDPSATCPDPLAYMAVPGPNEKSKFALFMKNRVPLFPIKFYQLEALNVGSFYFYYTYDADEKQLTVNYEYHFSTEKPIDLCKKIISVENESSILDAWREYEYKPGADEIKLSQEQEIKVEQKYNEAIKQVRMHINGKIVQAMMLLTPIQLAFENIEANVGLLHMYSKFLFEPYYQYDQPAIWSILNILLTPKVIESYLMNYNGDETHPYQLLKKSDEYYLCLAERMIESLKNKTLYVVNDSLNNALLYLDLEILHLLPAEKQLPYLEAVMKSTPDSAKALLYDLCGTLKIHHSLQDSLLEYSTAISLYPYNNAIFWHRAHCFMLSNQFDRAIADYNKILENLNQDLLLLCSKKSSASINILKEHIYVNMVAILIQQADAYLMGKYYAAALNLYNQLCSILPDWTEFNYRRAYSYECLENWDRGKIIV